MPLLCGNGYATESTEIYSLINERLSYMRNVAHYKYVKHLCIENRKREENVLLSAKEFAGENALDEVSVVNFFKVQIQIAKMIQHRATSHFYIYLPPTKVINLDSVLRPELIKIEKQLNEKLSEFLNEGKMFSSLSQVDFYRSVHSPYLTITEKDALFTALLAIQLKKMNVKSMFFPNSAIPSYVCQNSPRRIRDFLHVNFFLHLFGFKGFICVISHPFSYSSTM